MSKKNLNPFRRGDYRWWFLAETALECSASLGLAITLILVQVTGSVSAAGLIGGISSAVALLATFLGGALGDALPRRRLLLTTGSFSLACNLLLTILLVMGIAGVTGGAAPWSVIVVALLCVVVEASAAFRDPVLDASLKQIITPEEFPRAMSAAQARSSTLSMAGAPAAGWLFAVASFVPFAVRSVCDVVSLVLVRAIRADIGPRLHEGEEPRQSRRKIAGLTGLWRAITSFSEGWHHLRSRPELFRLLLCAPLVNLTVFGTMSWVVYRLTTDGHGSAVVGFASAGFAIGGVVGAALTPVLTDRFPAGWLVIVGLGFSMLVLCAMYAVPREPWVLMVLAGFSMLLSPALNGALFGYVFEVTGEALQSRVMATFALLGGLSTALAPVLASQAVMRGADAALGIGVGALGIAGVVWLASSSQVRGIGH
ncbi:MFS transporter [Corynebacterium lowii]|uniref:Major Facilitator Superfamily protein n=1 Tax=Corynebacterium lowii TaxID=1544413 RepID=A0A0Q0UG95_9CORY|nr:MFS transporter [Corynebacterium lowii]KQB87360.1 Major Facilitator Superfamily protein [Corynebacterium lowii]MDP9852051.1 MFS family permease [Corynebacterium lowii]